MRTALLSLSFVLVASAAVAQGHPNSLNMSCADARGLVRQSGAVVIATGSHLYDRFVTGPGYCSLVQTTEPAWIPTADNPQCLVGKLCVERRLKRRR